MPYSLYATTSYSLYVTTSYSVYVTTSYSLYVTTSCSFNANSYFSLNINTPPHIENTTCGGVIISWYARVNDERLRKHYKLFLSSVLACLFHFLILFLLSLGKNGSNLLVNLLHFSAHLLAGRAFAWIALRLGFGVLCLCQLRLSKIPQEWNTAEQKAKTDTMASTSTRSCNLTRWWS